MLEKEKLDSIISSLGIYRFSDKLFSEHPEVETLSGNGTGAKIINQLSIGENTIVGAGAVVINSLPSNCTVVGVPASIVKKNA